MSASLCIAIIALSFTPAPPLSDEQRLDLSAARDDADYREQAFFALVQNAREWTSPAIDDEPIRLSPDYAALLEQPANYRGDLCRITGDLLQHSPLAPPYEDVTEWFVRDDRTGTPVIVYVVKSDIDRAFRDREHVQIDGRFYKRLRFAARDRKVREYPGFVGRFPIATPPTTRPVSSPIAPGPGSGGRGLDVLAIVAGPVAVLAILLFGLRAWVSRKSRVSVERLREGRAAWLREPEDETAVDESAGLPDDPAEALAELRRRATSPDHAGDHSQSAS